MLNPTMKTHSEKMSDGSIALIVTQVGDGDIALQEIKAKVEETQAQLVKVTWHLERDNDRVEKMLGCKVEQRFATSIQEQQSIIDALQADDPLLDDVEGEYDHLWRLMEEIGIDIDEVCSISQYSDSFEVDLCNEKGFRFFDPNRQLSWNNKNNVYLDADGYTLWSNA